MATCSVCGEESPPRARFCWSCGTALAAAHEPPREVRKTVTVVFCDLAGSTALAADRDPEALRRVLTRYFEEMRSVLEQHGGTVEKFIGDAVMAVFGTPVVREDDAVRAVRAALEMRGRVPALNEAFQREWGMSISVRLGVNTGEVVAGDAAARQTFVTGEAVNVAQRLESAAPANQILIGADTYRLVRDLVDVEAVAPLVVRGKGRPVEAYRLLGLRAAAARRDSPMVGRSRELAALVEAFAGVLEARECRLVSVVGDAGVGKSRLLAELVRSVEGDALAVTGRCLPYGEGITYFPLIEVLRRVAGIAEEDDDDSARAK